MERPYKRQRLTEPPELDLLYRRDQNDRRLKSTFEAIFEKYGRDFDGIGDEIDLETGEIVVNNGHVLGMVNERDPGDLEEESVYDSDEWSDGEEILASSLLLETRRRLGALEYAEFLQSSGYVDDEIPSEGDVDSLIGVNDSLVGDSGPEAILPPTRQTSFPPENPYNDSTEDELASSDLEWPTPGKIWSTPGKVWPTPKTATPLGQMPWHSSPVKRSHSDNPPIDPVWKSPPLPTRNRLRRHAQIQSPRNRGRPLPVKRLLTHEPPIDPVLHPPPLPTHNQLQKPGQPVNLPQRQKAMNIGEELPTPTNSPRGENTTDVRTELPVHTHSHRNQGRAIPASSKSPHNPSGTLDSQSKSVSKDETQPKRETRGTNPRWTKDEENCLFRLRTTTKLTYSEILPYFPGRERHAIQVRWSLIMKKCELGETYRYTDPDTVVISSNSRSSEKHENVESDIYGDSTTTISSAGTPELRSHLEEDVHVQAPASTNQGHSAASVPPAIEKAPERRELGVNNSTVSVESQSTDSPPRHILSQKIIPTPSYRNASTESTSSQSANSPPRYRLSEQNLPKYTYRNASIDSITSKSTNPPTHQKPSQQTPQIQSCRNTSSEPIKSQSINSPSRHRLSQQTLPASCYWKASTPNEVKGGRHEQNIIQKQASSHKTEFRPTMIPRTAYVSKAQQSPSQPPITKTNQPERVQSGDSGQNYVAKSTSNTRSPSVQVSDFQRLSPVTSKKPVFLPSYISDDSEDELSTPIKTVGGQ